MRRFGSAGKAARRAGTLIFDCDGVLADTERYGHLPAFNQTFEEFGLPVRWSEEEYAQKLLDRRRQGADGAACSPRSSSPRPGCRPTATGQDEALAAWHRRKTAIYTAMVADGKLPGRPGIAPDHRRGRRRRLAARGRVHLGRAVRTGRARARGRAGAGPGRRGASPATSCRRRSRRRTSTSSPSGRWAPTRPDTLVVEDSRNGLLAATGAGLPCAGHRQRLHRGRGLHRAALVVSSLGDPRRAGHGAGQPHRRPHPGDSSTLTDLAACMARDRTGAPDGR